MENINENLIECAKKFVKELMKNNDPSHDWHHVERVFKNANYILNQELKINPDLKFNLKIIQLAALFHDIVDFKYDHEQSKDLKQVANERLANFFEQFKHECTADEKCDIIEIILNISWRKELEDLNSNKIISNELKIVRDADRLDAIGAIGIARCFGYSCAKNRPFFTKDSKPLINMSAEEYNQQTIKNESNAINHFYEKLLLIKDRMQTLTGKQLAEQRHQCMLSFLKEFHNEIDLN